ncbi:TPA: hypothetical protein R4104_002308 [Enterobacter asburiae]|uniref:hypothetical protein n=1 Tax=Enterobacter asburiae TaxID=61645 RepID=UPI000793EBEB|nr:hypothetical protein [Enterobacter asburiae]SAF06448.1 Uncharacterised protein [Enterobacter cloacae]MDL4615210.1 hypothetical protein [Enterobacter asburiae]HCM9126666.1 hypothetical protein [Enterobacter asburiae]HCM9130624.1 hypothetical protein [Enterobacter asburiae]HDW1996038.1 hypothetical protein [Enterobacter asburiae]
MKRMILLLLLIATNACAGMYPNIYPYKTTYNSQYYYYTSWIKTVITEVGPGTDVIPPAGYFVKLFVKNPLNGDVDDIDSSSNLIADGKRTLGDLVMEAYNGTAQNYKNGSLTFNYTDGCLLWGASPSRVGSGSTFITAGQCNKIPPVTQVCKFITQDILLDHGSISQADGDSVTKNITINCTNSSSVEFILPTQDGDVIMDEGLSHITINNLPLGSKIDLPSGTSDVKITDKLVGITTEGEHSGSSVLVMQLY